MEDNSILRDKIITHLCARLHNCELSGNDLVLIIEAIGAYGNLQTFADYARDQKISYNGVKDRIDRGGVKVVKLFNVKFILDNQ